MPDSVFITVKVFCNPPFPGLCRFPQGHCFKQWMGDDFKAPMKVYLPSLVGYVPDDMISCLGAFLDACYIAQCQDINLAVLDDFDHFVEKFMQLHKAFQISGIRHEGFALPWQHLLLHYQCMIKDFGAPGGLCSSITESCHVTAVNRPYR